MQKNANISLDIQKNIRYNIIERKNKEPRWRETL